MERNYPIGVQSFEKIRKDNYVYIDKKPGMFTGWRKPVHIIF